MNDNPFEIKEEDNGICEMIPRAGSSKANIVPPTAADCGEEC